MTSYARKVHLAGRHCGSASGAGPAPTATLVEFVRLPVKRRCVSCNMVALYRAVHGGLAEPSASSALASSVPTVNPARCAQGGMRKAPDPIGGNEDLDG